MNNTKPYLAGFLFVMLLLSLGVAAIAEDPGFQYGSQVAWGRAALPSGAQRVHPAATRCEEVLTVPVARQTSPSAPRRTGPVRRN